MATPKWYANGLLNVAAGNVSLDGDTIKLLLATSGYTPSQTTHAFRSDLGANEASGGSYPAGGWTLATRTLTIVSGLTVQWDADDITQSITGGPVNFQYGVYYKARGGASSADELIAYVDFGSQTITSATLTVTQTNQLTITAS